MADLFSTQYPNNIRSVTAGDVISQQVYRDDVVLNCDTSGAGLPFTINLLEIPANYWNTIYKLYVVDTGNNASGRNITINAPVGHTINGASSVTISTNGGGVLIRILDNYTYMATLNNISTGGGDCCQIVSLTNAQLLTLISTSAISPLKTYMVTDPLYASSVLLQGFMADTNTAIQGEGVFYNADYQGVGNYSGVFGFVDIFGIWRPTGGLPINPLGYVVIWYNQHYVNITNAWGTTPDTDGVNWKLLPVSSTNGYIKVIDFIRYNVTTNEVIYRADKNKNEVDLYVNGKGYNSLVLFQWGRDTVVANKLRGGLMNCTNSYCSFAYNEICSTGELTDATANPDAGSYSRNYISQQGNIEVTTQNNGSVSNNIVSGLLSKILFNAVQTGCSVKDNNITQASNITGNNITAGGGSFGTVSRNTVFSHSSISLNNISGGITDCYLSDFGTFNFGNVSGLVIGCESSDSNQVNITTLTANYTAKKIRKGYSNWELTIDLNDALYWNGVDTITIPASQRYVGIFTTTNGAGKTAVNITGFTDNHRFTIKPDVADSITVKTTAIAGAVAGNIVGNSYTQTLIGTLLVGRANGCDEVVLNAYGSVTGIVELNSWA